MKRRFKTKNKKRRKNILILLIIGLITFYITYRFLFLHLIRNYIKEEDLVAYLTSNSKSNSIKNPMNLINYSLSNMITKPNIPKKEILVSSEEEKPLIYLYNTHQEEKYSKEYLEIYNLTPTVLTASYILEEDLNNLGVKAITEERSVKEILENQNLLYKDSYVASRYLLEDSKLNYPSLEYFIDIHRDSSSKDKTTTTIDNKSYAKVLFVIGKEHENYEQNLDFANRINNLLVNYNESLSRGIYIKEGMLVNGIYNQDFNGNTILIEVGGIENNIEEVNNTLNVLSKVLIETIG